MFRPYILSLLLFSSSIFSQQAQANPQQAAQQDPGFILTRKSTPDFTQMNIKPTGDINGDGLDDLSIHKTQIWPSFTQKLRAGNRLKEALILYGQRQGLQGELDLANFVKQAGTRLIYRDPQNQQLIDLQGSSAVTGGDFNGDGLNDMLLKSDRGWSLLLGQKSGWGQEFDLSQLEKASSLGLRIQEPFEHEDYVLHQSSAYLLGDINGDGCDDLGFSVSYDESSLKPIPFSNRLYILYGKKEWQKFPKVLTDVNGQNGFYIHYDNEHKTDLYLYSIIPSRARDVNGDGFEDILILSLASKKIPDIYTDIFLLPGQAQAFPEAVNLKTLQAQWGQNFSLEFLTQKPKISPEDTLKYYRFDAPGDLNGDGFADIFYFSVLSAMKRTQLNTFFRGSHRLKYGAPLTQPNPAEVTWHESRAFVLPNENFTPKDRIVPANFVLGNSQSLSGDINGDGLSDYVAIRNQKAPVRQANLAYIFWGQKTKLSGDQRLRHPQTNTSTGQPQQFQLPTFPGLGYGHGIAGDLNGDGYDELYFTPFVDPDLPWTFPARSLILWGRPDLAQRDLSAEIKQLTQKYL